MWTAVALAPLAALALAGTADAAGTAPVRPAALAEASRCVARYLDAVRHAAPSPPAVRPPRELAVTEDDYAEVKRLTAPSTLAAVARGARPEMAPWRDAGRERFLESFELLGARHAPRAAVVVSVREQLYLVRAGGERLEPRVSEYLVARVDGAWRVVDRRPGGRFSDDEVAAGFAGEWDGEAPAP